MPLQPMRTVAEAAKVLHMHPNQVRIEIKAGRLRAKKTNSPRGTGKLARYLIPEAELKRYQDNLADAHEPAAAAATAPGGAAPPVEDPPARKRRASTKGGADWV